MEARSLDELARLAADATPGPWRYPSGGAVVDALGQAVVFGELRPADAAYIAAASPSVVLALIERVRAAEALLRERAAIEYDIADDADRAAEAEFLRPIGGGL